MTHTKAPTNEKEIQMTASPIRMRQRSMEEDLNPHRRTAVLVGALFLLSTATFILSNALITPLLNSPNFLAEVSNHTQLMVAATLIGLIEGIATVGIAVALYPILKRQHPALALGYTGMRIAELAVAAVGFGLGGLLLVTLSATAANGPTSEMLGTLLVALRPWTLMLVYLYTALGGLMLSYMLLRTRLIPRGLSVLGLIGYAALLLASMLDMLGIIDLVAGVGLVWLVPGGLFELLLPIWLFVRGFNVTARNSIRIARVSG
jgi:MFS family permease